MVRKFDLEDRFIDFSIGCIRLARVINVKYEGEYLAKQLMRSAMGATLNYGEVQAAESKRDFIHKMAIVLKELKESRVNLKIQKGIDLMDVNSQLESSLNECEELIAIVAKSIQTAKIRMKIK